MIIPPAAAHRANRYDQQRIRDFFAMNLDPSNQTFWTADYSTGTVCEFDIDSGLQLRSITCPPGVFSTAGLAICGELLVSKPECEDPSPRTQGFWRLVCKKNHPDLFDRSILTDELCADLNPDPRSDPCERARSQLAALLLNIGSDRIQDSCIATETGETVDELEDTIEVLIEDDDAESDVSVFTANSCKEASDLAASVNEGGVTEP